MRAYAGPTVVRVALQHPEYGTWGGGQNQPEKRNREGLYPGDNIVTASLLNGGTLDVHAPILSDDELWAVYRRVPDVRASFDSVIRLISTWDWGVAPVEGLPKDDPLYDRALDLSEEIRRFFSAPNEDGDVWQTWVSKACRDLMVYDEWATENVIGTGGLLEELVNLAGGSVTPRADRHSRVVDYKQTAGGESVFLSKEQVLYFNLFPNSSRPGGTPLIETILNEVITLMNQSKHLLLAYDADEIPPGVFMLAGIAGDAAKRAVEGLQNMAGSDHKIRVVTTNNPQGLDGKWVEFRRTPKDLDMASLVKEIRRTVWRVVGVKPITMGDSEATPKATGEVQLEAEDSGLIRPILELLQANINTRVLPLLTDEETAGLVEFKFNLDRDASAEDRELDAKADALDFDRAGLTVNELREKRGRLPLEGGDIALMKQGGGYVTLASILEEDEDEVVEDEPQGGQDGQEEDGEVSDDSEDAGTPDEGEEAPGEAEASRPRVGSPIRSRERRVLTKRVKSCACGQHRSEPRRSIQERASSLLPSEWQPGSKFDDVRTIDLPKLGDVLIDYARRVEPLYLRAKLDTEAIFRSYVMDGDLTTEDAAQLASRASAVLDKLSTDWENTTEEHYRDAARLGRDAATDFTRTPVVADWETRASLYQGQAMSYLKEDRGLIADLRAQLLTLVAANIRGTEANTLVRARLQVREGEAEAFAIGILAGVAKTFSRNQHRIKNWSGRLVELANNILGFGMAEGGDEPPEDEEGPAGTGWVVEWASVGDNRMCPTCDSEGSQGFRELSQLSTRPGGDTECRGRCRCVLVFWRQSEVTDGTAIRLSNTAK